MKKKISIILVLILTFALGFISGTYFKINNNINTNKKMSKNNLETSTTNTKKEELTPSPIEYNIIEISMNSANTSTVSLSLKNNGEDTLKNIDFFIIAWDINGYPLKLDFGRQSYLKMGANQINILKGESKEYSWRTNSFNDEIVGQYEIVPYKAEFYDGTIWQDDNAEDKAKELFEEVRK